MVTRILYTVFLSLVCINIGGATPPYQQNQIIKQDNVIVKQKIVEFDADTYLGLGGYYAVQDELAEKHSTAKQLEKKDAQIDALIKLLENKYGNPGVTPTQPELPPVEQPVTPPSEPTPVDNTSLDGKVFAIFKKACINCHGPNQSSGKLKLIGRDVKGEFLVDIGLKAARVYDRTAGIKLKERHLQLMPVGSQPLSDEDVQTLHVWSMANVDKAITQLEKGK